MQCDECYRDPCVCQKALRVPSHPSTVPQKYRFLKCCNERCTVMIGLAAGGLQGSYECKWCQAGMSHWQRGV